MYEGSRGALHNTVSLQLLVNLQLIENKKKINKIKIINSSKRKEKVKRTMRLLDDRGKQLHLRYLPSQRKYQISLLRIG